MSDFPFYKQGKDYFGHVVYYCKCSICGTDVAYGRKVWIDPLCSKCKQKEFNRKNRAKHDAKVKAKALDELKDMLPDCDMVEIEHLITLMEMVKEKNDGKILL